MSVTKKFGYHIRPGNINAKLYSGTDLAQSFHLVAFISHVTSWRPLTSTSKTCIEDRLTTSGRLATQQMLFWKQNLQHSSAQDNLYGSAHMFTVGYICTVIT
jgi:hypothetical protein